MLLIFLINIEFDLKLFKLRNFVFMASKKKSIKIKNFSEGTFLKKSSQSKTIRLRI
jgi:hypothetical protein